MAEKFFRPRPGTRRGSFKMVVDTLYRDSGKEASSDFTFDKPVLEAFIKHIYEKDFHPMTDIELDMFLAVWNKLDIATDKGFGEREPDDPDYDFYRKLQTNNAVFAAFKVHRMQNDMAALLLDSNGILKPFEQWAREAMPIADHQVYQWLQTEYDTAVIRAHQAADWKQFEREKDILPNLKWMPSTSLHPGADHRLFWGTIRPIEDAFWNEHRPGDRWNCKCSLSSTDEEPTQLPESDPASKPQAGLENNPGKDAKLFSDKHPYQSEAHAGAKKAVDRLTERINEMIDEMPDNLTYEEKKAIAVNNLELEKALGIKKGKPMSVEEADKQNANPKHADEFVLDPNGIFYDKGGRRYRKNADYDEKKHKPYNINCQTCAPAYALRLKGFDITAKGNIPGSKLEYLSKGRAFEIWKNIDGTPAKHISINDWLLTKGYLKMTPKRYWEYFNEVCKEEGVYELCIGWKNGGGHATILQRFANGELRYIEPQSDNSKGSGMEWKDVKYLCDIGAPNSHSCRGLIRIDNKLFDIWFFDIFDI